MLFQRMIGVVAELSFGLSRWRASPPALRSNAIGLIFDFARCPYDLTCLTIPFGWLMRVEPSCSCSYAPENQLRGMRTARALPFVKPQPPLRGLSIELHLWPVLWLMSLLPRFRRTSVNRRARQSITRFALRLVDPAGRPPPPPPPTPPPPPHCDSPWRIGLGGQRASALASLVNKRCFRSTYGNMSAAPGFGFFHPGSSGYKFMATWVDRASLEFWALS